MENQPNTMESLFENAGDYLETRIDLLRLQAIYKSSDASSSIVSKLTILYILKFAMLILNIGLAIWVGELLGKVYLGFFVVGGFYGMVGLVIHIFRNSWLKEPLNNLIIKKLLK